MLDFDAMQRHLASKDPVGVLLRGHLWVEQAVVELISVELPLADEWQDLRRISWPSKLGLARAQGSLPDFESFRVLNTLRNRLAHSPAFEPDVQAGMDLARAVVRDFESESNVYGLTFAIPDSSSADAADILRAAISALLEYLFAVLVDALEMSTRRLEEQARRLREWTAQTQQSDES